jgi:carboxyl-terminal processing protease
MPDVFVPMDTSDNSKYFTDILRVGVTNDWTMVYADKYRASLKEKFPTYVDFVKGFQFSDQDLSSFLEAVAAKNVVFDEKGWATSKKVIEVRMRALVARALYENDAFYMVINEINPAFKKGLEILGNGEYEKVNLAFQEYKMFKTKAKK